MLDREYTFVLGARDPEMREIASILGSDRRPYVHAAVDGRPVAPRTAYEANTVVFLSAHGRPHPALLVPQQPTVSVECLLTHHAPDLRVDHHNPGDPGYAMPPERYLNGSSLGQTLRLLEREATPTQRLLAAADHCLTAAYQGQCPGIDPHELLFLRASWRSRVSGRTLGDVMEGVLHAAKLVGRHYDSEYRESVFTDPTEIPPDLAEGAAYAGHAVRYRELLPDGVVKEMLKGAAVRHIERFMDEHARAGHRVYGNPHRGYAGAYLDA